MTAPTPAGDWDPVLYDLFKQERQRPVHDLLAMVRPGRGGRAADLGCGTGEYTVWLHQRSGATQTVGIDSSPEMLSRAAQYASDDITFERRDLRDLRGEFDVLFSNAALHWIADQRDAIADVVGHLAVGGQLAVQLPSNFDHPSHVVADEVGQTFGLDALSSTAHALAPAEYASTLWDLGLVDIDVSLRVYGVELARTDQVVDWVSGSLLSTFRARLEPDEYRAFVDEYTHRLLLRLGDPAGSRPYFYTYPRVLFTARRPF